MIILLILLLGISILAAFIIGMYVYRLGVNDGLKRKNGAVVLDPLRDRQNQTEQDDDELLDAISSYDGGTIKIKR